MTSQVDSLQLAVAAATQHFTGLVSRLLRRNPEWMINGFVAAAAPHGMGIILQKGKESMDKGTELGLPLPHQWAKLCTCLETPYR